MGDRLSERELELFKFTSAELLGHLRSRLTSRGRWKVKAGKGFVYSTGNLPVLLVAHVDTVHYDVPDKIFYDSIERVLWSPDGLGADDRAGVLGILRLLDKGYAPHVLFTDEEEYGCVGATEAVQELTDPGVRFVVELDRKNGREAVFYDCDNKDFKKYITGFGYVEAGGSYTDISVICPAWNVAGVNLSCGYYNAHTVAEHLNLHELEGSLALVEEILQNIPRKRFPYQLHYSKPRTQPRQDSAKVYDLYEETYTDCDYTHTYQREEYLYVPVDTELLADLFGGDPVLWERWLDSNFHSLTSLSEQVVLTAAQHDAENGVLELLYDYA